MVSDRQLGLDAIAGWLVVGFGNMILTGCIVRQVCNGKNVLFHSLFTLSRYLRYPVLPVSVNLSLNRLAGFWVLFWYVFFLHLHTEGYIATKYLLVK